MNRFHPYFVAPALMVVACAAQAQLLEDVDIRREGADAVVQIRFTVPIQYRRAVSSRSNDLTQAYYDLVGRIASPSVLTTSERRLAASPGLPQITVTDESVGRADLNRKLIIRFSTPTPFRVRAGKGDRVIEVVLPGLGSNVAKLPVSPKSQAAPPDTGIQITLHASEQPNLQLEAAIPSALQAYPVVTARRVVGGKVVYLLNMGPFETEADARNALAVLLPRFPQAVIAMPAPAPAPVVATTPAVPVPAVPAAALPTTPALPGGAGAEAPPASAAEVEARAAVLLAGAKAGLARDDFAVALDQLNQLLELPPNASSREAQEMVGMVRLKVGDFTQARAEFELFLKLYPAGADSDRVRAEVARLPQPVAAAERVPAPTPTTSTITGSVSQFFYGGQSKVRTQEFQDSPLGGVPILVSDETLSGTDQKQAVSNLDFNWRYRDTDTDMRFVFRDAWTADLMPDGTNQNRLSALYFEHRSLPLATSVRVGRQSPTGGGVLGRFDGVQLGYGFRPKWRANAVVGVPVDLLLDSKRHFYGAWIDAESLTPELSGSVYLNQQVIDGVVDRRALGTELRYFNGGVSASGVLDYDLILKGLNIASLQGTWIAEDTTTVNALYDRRATPMLMLGNALFFQDPLKPLATRLKDLLTGAAGIGTIDALRQNVKSTTSYTTQALLGVTRPIRKNWQLGADIRLTNVGAIEKVPVILPEGAPGTGNLWSLGAQLIGTNLYSERDTHVFSVTYLTGPTYNGKLFIYNNSSQLDDAWQLEPSFKYYRQNDKLGTSTTRLSPGLRVSWRVAKQAAVESELSVERSKTSTATGNESSSRAFYYLGGRYDF